MLSADAFNDMLAAIGQSVSWRRATQCPCRDPFSGAASPCCPVCAGAGITWGPQISADLALSGMKSTRQFQALGRWEAGDVVVTIPSDSPAYLIGENDRVEFVDSSEPFSVVVLPDDCHKLLFLPLYVERVCWIADGVLVDGDPPRTAPDGTMFWQADQLGPPKGAQYTVSGRRRPEYYVLDDLGQDRAHAHGLTLPRRIQLRKFSLFRGGGATGTIAPPGD